MGWVKIIFPVKVGGGTNTKGQGETNIEIMKRHFRTQIRLKKDELNKLAPNIYCKLREENLIIFKAFQSSAILTPGKLPYLII